MSDNTDLQEEIFCLKYELDTLANVTIRNESERWVPGFLHEQTEYSHISRYNLACKYTAGKKVIDVACGVGKGSYLLATEGAAANVSGFDIQPDAIRYAKWRYKNSNIEFDVKNAEALEIYDKYDFAVSFETVEHLPNYRDFFSSINKCLKAGGLFLISTPISALPIDNNPANPYHIQEWGFKEFQDVLKEFFDIQKIYVQLYPYHSVNTMHSQSGILTRGYNKIKRKLFGFNDPAINVNENKTTENKFSKIEEFTGQYNIEEFGVSRIGYQIALVKKKSL